MDKELWVAGESMHTHRYNLAKLQCRINRLSDSHPGIKHHESNLKEFKYANLTILNQLVNICVEQQKEIDNIKNGL